MAKQKKGGKSAFSPQGLSSRKPLRTGIVSAFPRTDRQFNAKEGRAMATRRNRAISLGLGAVLLLLLVCVGAGEVAAVCEISSFYDRVSDQKPCARSTRGLGGILDPLNSPKDVDWYYKINDGIAHPNSAFGVRAPSSAIRCSVYLNDNSGYVGTSTAAPGHYCRVTFLALGSNKYYFCVGHPVAGG